MKNVIYFMLISLVVFTSCKKDSNSTSPTEDVSTISYSGKVYHTVKIGNQTWLKENLDVGVMIDSLQNPSNNVTIEKYCYGNDTANCTKYGGLYQWDEAMAYDTTEGSTGICPTGWHIPTTVDYAMLSKNVNNHGNSLKAVGQGEGTDFSGFSALMAGLRRDDGTFGFIKSGTGFWSSTYYGTMHRFFMNMSNSTDGIYLSTSPPACGHSIRCIKDN